MQELREAWGRYHAISVNRESLLQALEVGLGAHHSGINKDYRQHVEILFREKRLGVRMCGVLMCVGEGGEKRCVGGATSR